MTEKTYYLVATGVLVLVLSIAGGMFSLIYTNRPAIAARTLTAPSAVPPKVAPSDIVFNPPAPQEAPPALLDSVQTGYNIVEYTRRFAPNYVGNELNCSNCHFDGGRGRPTISLAGAAAAFPKPLWPNTPPVSLAGRVAECFRRNLNAEPPPPDSNEMSAIVGYIHWISSGVPIYSRPPWLGLQPLQVARADASEGMKSYATICSTCHGPDGMGTPMAPPLWGDGSYTTGSDMLVTGKLESFISQFMPRGNPGFDPVVATNVGAFIRAEPRPQYQQQQAGRQGQ